MGRNKTISDAELLGVARKAFVELGFNVSTREIARRAGVSEGVLFQRFVTKEDLFFTAMIPPPSDLDELFQSAPSEGPELIEKITLSMLEYFRATLPVLTRLMAHPAFRFEEFARRQPESPLVTLRRDLTQFMAREIGAGRIGDVNPGAAALLVWSTANTIAFFEHMGAHDGHMPPAIVRAAVQGLWTGLAPRQPTAALEHR